MRFGHNHSLLDTKDSYAFVDGACKWQLNDLEENEKHLRAK